MQGVYDALGIGSGTVQQSRTAAIQPVEAQESNSRRLGKAAMVAGMAVGRHDG